MLSPGSSEQHGSSSTTNMNVNVISPEKVSGSTKRRYETQVCDEYGHAGRATRQSLSDKVKFTKNTS